MIVCACGCWCPLWKVLSALGYLSYSLYYPLRWKKGHCPNNRLDWTSCCQGYICYAYHKKEFDATDAVYLYSWQQQRTDTIRSFETTDPTYFATCSRYLGKGESIVCKTRRNWLRRKHVLCTEDVKCSVDMSQDNITSIAIINGLTGLPGRWTPHVSVGRKCSGVLQVPVRSSHHYHQCRFCLLDKLD